MPASTVAVVPVKRFDAAKQRLSGALAAEARIALARAMLDDVLARIAECRPIDEVIVVSGEPRARSAGRAAGALLVDDPGDRGHSEAATLGVTEALRRRAGRAALLPGDCPLLRAEQLGAALGRLQSDGVAVIPDRHGSGTNGLLLDPPAAIAPAFGPGSRERHLELARAAGIGAVVEDLPSLALDLDTGADLERLLATLAPDPERAPATAAALGRIGRVRR